jgi:hypothetical protein
LGNQLLFYRESCPAFSAPFNGDTLPFTSIADLTSLTNYQNAVFDNTHTGNDASIRVAQKSTYAFGVAVLSQDVIVGSDKSDFDRFTLRANFDQLDKKT